MTTTTQKTLSVSDAVSLSQILGAMQRCAPVARLIDDEVVPGQASHIVAPRPNFLSTDLPLHTDDVRDCSLRVYLDNDGIADWPIAELMDEIKDGRFVVNYEPPKRA